MIFLLPLYIAAAHLIAKYIGAKRKIGYWRAFFLSLLFSPAFGLICCFLTKKEYGYNYFNGR